MTVVRVAGAICVLAMLASGCSTFERDWEAAAGAATPADGLEGRWQGTWQSEASGHGGGLRCIVTRGSTGAYDARYHATYGGTLTFEYSVALAVEREGDAYRFRGSADLGWLAGGVYDYEGRVVGASFFSTYRSSSDHGTFTLSREK